MTTRAELFRQKIKESKILHEFAIRAAFGGAKKLGKAVFKTAKFGSKLGAHTLGGALGGAAKGLGADQLGSKIKSGFAPAAGKLATGAGTIGKKAAMGAGTIGKKAAMGAAGFGGDVAGEFQRRRAARMAAKGQMKPPRPQTAQQTRIGAPETPEVQKVETTPYETNGPDVRFNSKPARRALPSTRATIANLIKRRQRRLS